MKHFIHYLLLIAKALLAFPLVPMGFIFGAFRVGFLAGMGVAEEAYAYKDLGPKT